MRFSLRSTSSPSFPRQVTLAAALFVAISFSSSALFALAPTTTTVVATPSSSTYGQSVSFDATVTGIVGSPRKSVSLKEGATVLDTQNVNGQNHAIMTLTTLSVGTHSLVAAYEGNAGSDPSSSAPFNFVVSKAASTTTMTAPSAITYGNSAPFTATVTGPGAVKPTGTVTFKESGNTLCSGPLALVGGVPTATCNAAGLGAGSHSVVAEYGGDGSYDTSNGATQTQNVNQASTTTTVVPTPNPSSVTTAVTITATVSSGAAGTIGGTVDFYDGVTKLNENPVALTGNSAQFITSDFALGTHSLTAQATGDTNYAGSTSSGVDHVVELAPTTTSVAADPNPSTFGVSVTFTATVGSAVSGTIGGTVDFYDGVTKLNDTPIAVSSGEAEYSTSALSIATHSITAQYSGDSTYATSTSDAVSQVVNNAVTTATLAADPNPSTLGVSVAFTATVASAVTGTISGSVDFYDGVTKLNDTPVTLTGGQAAFPIATLSLGSHSITAQYLGDSTYATSTSDVVTQVVNLAITSTSVAAVPSPASSGESVTLTATITSLYAGTIGGTADFYDGATKLNDTPVAVTAGSAQYATSALGVGLHFITAQYLGDATYAGSTSGVTTLNVRDTSSVTLISSPNPVKVGNNVLFTATVTPNTATGTVSLVENGNTIASGGLTGGVANINVSILAVGSHTIEAHYSGNVLLAPSISSPVVQAVTGRPRSDLNNDGRSDIVLQNTISSSIAAWLMNNNSILEGKVVANPIPAWKINATGDFDGDGKADLLLQNTSTGAIAEWKMNGTALVAGFVITTTSTNWRIVGTRDFDGDGKSDIIVQNMATGSVHLWLMNGGVLVSDNDLGTAAPTERVVGVGRLGGNAIVLQDTATGAISRWIVSGTTVTSNQAIGTPASADIKVLAVGDYNSDGNDDLGLQNTTTRTVSIWLLSATGAGVLSSGVVATPVAGWAVVGGGDYDGDGYGDLLLHNSITNGIAEWQMNGVVIARGWNVGTLAGWKPLGN